MYIYVSKFDRDLGFCHLSLNYFFIFSYFFYFFIFFFCGGGCWREWGSNVSLCQTLINAYTYTQIFAWVQENLQLTHLAMELSLIGSNLSGEFSAFSSSKTFRNSPFCVPSVTHLCWVDTGKMIQDAYTAPSYMSAGCRTLVGDWKAPIQIFTALLTSATWWELVLSLSHILLLFSEIFWC